MVACQIVYSQLVYSQIVYSQIVYWPNRLLQIFVYSLRLVYNTIFKSPTQSIHLGHYLCGPDSPPQALGYRERSSG